jgi:ABC-type uncharacterized transport system permease subunit
MKLRNFVGSLSVQNVVKLMALGCGLLLALLAVLGLAMALGEGALEVAKIIWLGAWGSTTALGYSLYYATPLVFTGLAVAWAMRVGLFNIGAEGQMTMGGIAMVALGILLPGLPSIVAWPLALFLGAVVGAAWAAIPAWFKVRRGTHEVLVCILMNFVAYGVGGFLILHLFRNPESQNPETLAIGSGFQWPQLAWMGGQSPLNATLGLAFVIVLVLSWLSGSTRFGLRQRWVGGAAEFAERSGVSPTRHQVVAMLISGALAGMAGSSILLGYLHKAREGFAGGAGFIGIAVALLGGLRPWGVLAAAVLFGGLQKGAIDLDLDTEKISRDLATVMQAMVVVAVAALPLLNEFWSKRLDPSTSWGRRLHRWLERDHPEGGR